MIAISMQWMKELKSLPKGMREVMQAKVAPYKDLAGIAQYLVWLQRLW